MSHTQRPLQTLKNLIQTILPHKLTHNAHPYGSVCQVLTSLHGASPLGCRSEGEEVCEQEEWDLTACGIEQHVTSAVRKVMRKGSHMLLLLLVHDMFIEQLLCAQQAVLPAWDGHEKMQTAGGS